MGKYRENHRHRFFDRVKKTNDCWLWLGTILQSGYGQISWRGKGERAHRISYMIHYDEIPEGALILHHCDNPACVNPDHLYAGTHQDNMNDKTDRGRCHSLHGEANPNAKLTTDDVLAIRNAKGSCKDIGKQYGVGAMQISRIKRKLRWGHI